MRKTAKILYLCALLFSAFTHAGIEGVRFTDTTGATKELSASESLYNPQNTLQLFVSAGLDRKLRTSIVNDAGDVVFSHTSDWVRVEDRQSFQGRDFYGKTVSLPNLSEGAYTIKSELLDGALAVQDTVLKSIVIDKTGPAYSDIFADGNGSYRIVAGTASTWKLGIQGSTNFKINVNNVLDASGIDSATFVVNAADGSGYSREFEASIDSTTNRVYILELTVGRYIPQTNLDVPFDGYFAIKDKAGNVTHTEVRRFYYDTYSGAPRSPVAVYDPDTQDSFDGIAGFVPYQAGMAVKANPITLLYRVPRDNAAKNNEAGLSLYARMGTVEVFDSGDGQYVYYKLSLPYGMIGSNDVRWTDFGRWSAGSISYSLSLSPSVPQTPVISNAYYHLDATNQDNNLFGVVYLQNTLLPTQMDHFRFEVGVRPYDQRIRFNGGTCFVPAGQSECSIDSVVSMPVGSSGYLHGEISLRSEGFSTPELAASARWAEPTWNDQYYPELSSYSYDEAKGLVTAYVTMPKAGSWFDRLHLKTAVLMYGENQLNAIKTVRDVTLYEFTYDINSLPDGDYDLKLKLIENHGPTTIADLFHYVIEKSPPAIKITNEGLDNFSSIVGLDSLKLNVTDASDFEIDSVVLSGGPTSDSVYLAYTDQGDGDFALEYPRIYPSMVRGDLYQLAVQATDVYGNQSTKTVQFTYSPPNLVDAGSIHSLAINQLIKDSDNEPVSYVRTEQLRTDQGNLAIGPQQAYFTLRSDAGYAVTVNGVKVSPGQTIELSVVPVDGVVTLPVYPAVAGVASSAPFMFEIPQVTSNL